MKIVLIGPIYPYKGGIAHYTSLLYRALVKEHDVKLISYKMQYPKILFRKEQKDFSNDTFKVDDVEYLINTANPFNIIGVANKINKINPDAVLIQWWHPYFAPCYRILANHLKKGIKVLFTCHNVFPHERFFTDRFLTKMVLSRGDGFIVHSKRDEKDLLAIKRNANYLFNPIPSYNAFKLRDMSREDAIREIVEKDGFHIDSNNNILLFFGFVREYKGLRYLLQAMPRIVEKSPQTILMVVGSFGNDKVNYLELIKSLGIEENVFLKDDYTPDNEVEKYFAATDIVINPYIDATQSAIVQIAYGFYKPCIVTKVGGLPDVVQDGKTGYIVEAMDCLAIANSVIDFFSNSRYEMMRDEIKKDTYKFEWDRMEEQISNLIRM